MSENPQPSTPRNVRHRVAMPIESSRTNTPSLIPLDVLQDVQREVNAKVRDDAEREPRTAPLPVPDEVGVFTEVTANVEVAIKALSQVSLFSNLPRASLEAMAQGSRQLEIPDAEPLFHEGDEAQSFYVVLEGTLEIVREKEGREVALRHVGVGEAIGLFGLFSANLRAASARAIGDCMVIQISGAKLQTLLEKDDALHTKLLQFYRERLLEGFMASKLFSDIDSIARARLIGRFQNRFLETNEAILNPGEVSNLIAVVTHGSVILEERTQVGGNPKQLEVTTGQYLVVSCAMSGAPSRVRIFAPAFATVSVLNQKDLNELLRDYPALRALPSRLPGMARQVDRDIFCGTTGVPGL